MLMLDMNMRMYNLLLESQNSINTTKCWKKVTRM